MESRSSTAVHHPLQSTSHSESMNSKYDEVTAYEEHPTSSISIRNQQLSPLLRLPAELRNEICSYVCGGLEIAPSDPITPPQFTLYVRKFKNLDSYEEWGQYRNKPTTLSQVCRQLHLETSLLPFMLNHFRLCSLHAFHLFVSKLSDRQRNAIQVVAFDFHGLDTMSTEMSEYWTRVSRNKPQPVGASHEHFTPLRKLEGLQRVLVVPGPEYTDAGPNWADSLPKSACEAFIRQLGGR